MKRIGLPASQYDQKSREPKGTDGAAMELRRRGYNATANKLKKLVADGEIDPPDSDGKQAAWTRDRIEQAAKYFENAKDFTTDAAFLHSRGLTMTDHQAALNEAYGQALDQFGRVVPSIMPKADDSFFVLHLDSGSGKKPARIWYTLRDDVRAKLERSKKTK